MNEATMNGINAVFDVWCGFPLVKSEPPVTTIKCFEIRLDENLSY